MKAMSIWVSPVSIARMRPPWERRIAIFFSFPRLMASPIFPRTPELSIPVMVPSSIMGTRVSSAWLKEVALRVMSFSPISWIACITCMVARSPSRKWWWKLIVIPSWAWQRISASEMLGRSLVPLPPILARPVGEAFVYSCPSSCLLP